MTVTARFEDRITVDEIVSRDLGVSRLPHTWIGGTEFPFSLPDGTGASQQDVVFTDTRIAAAAVDDLDLRGGLNSQLTGLALQFVEVTTLAIRNTSTVSGEFLLVGAGSNPWITWLGATGDILRIGPGGILRVSSPIDGFATTAATADILRIDPGAATITYDIMLLGRSA